MDLSKVLAQLHAELDNVNAAIFSLERLQQGGKHRGRPPEWFQELTSVVKKRKPGAAAHGPSRHRAEPLERRSERRPEHVE